MAGRVAWRRNVEFFAGILESFIDRQSHLAENSANFGGDLRNLDWLAESPGGELFNFWLGY
jgi:hypothetical protein